MSGRAEQRGEMGDPGSSLRSAGAKSPVVGVTAGPLGFTMRRGSDLQAPPCQADLPGDSA